MELCNTRLHKSMLLFFVLVLGPPPLLSPSLTLLLCPCLSLSEYVMLMCFGIPIFDVDRALGIACRADCWQATRLTYLRQELNNQDVLREEICTAPKIQKPSNLMAWTRSRSSYFLMTLTACRTS
jgi:hypothetical protein